MRPLRIAYAVNRDSRLSWGGLPAPGRDLSPARPDACHLMPDVVGAVGRHRGRRGHGEGRTDDCLHNGELRRQQVAALGVTQWIVTRYGAGRVFPLEGGDSGLPKQ